MVNSRRFVDACELMHRLLQVSPLPADIAPSEIHDAGLYLCNGFANCPPGEAKALSAEKLIQIAVECCGIDHYAMMPAFRILYYHRQANWPQLRHTVINSNWSAMYAASLVMAEATSSQGVGRALAEITELTSSSDILEQELGLYALKLLKADAKKVMELARRFAGSDVYVVIAVLNELLLTQALDGEDACGFIDDVNMWKAPWPYHRTQLVDIAAVQELLRNSSTPFSAEVEVARAREELAATLRLREELLELPAITADPILGNLLRNYEKLPRKLTDIPVAEGPIRRSAAMDRLLLLLFAHPAWEVRAGASKVAASVAGGRPEVEQLISQWLDHADYRVRYAAVEAAYHLRYRNQAALFEHAVRRRAGDEQSWVRGIVADCLAEWILREGEQDYAERVQRFKSEAVELLNYNDVWPLEAMQLVVRRLREHDIDVMALLGKPIGGLLGQIPQWDTLDRAELEPALDALLRSR